MRGRLCQVLVGMEETTVSYGGPLCLSLHVPSFSQGYAFQYSTIFQTRLYPSPPTSLDIRVDRALVTFHCRDQSPQQKQPERGDIYFVSRFHNMSPLWTVRPQTERKQGKGDVSIGLGLLGDLKSVKLMVAMMHLRTVYKCFSLVHKIQKRKSIIF